MASSTQVRNWWRGYQRTPSKYVRVAFPISPVDFVRLPVAGPSQPVWEAVAQIMGTTPYYFREMAGGTYNPRTPGSTSLHTYAIAIDLNPSKNPMKPPPLVYDYPEKFITRMDSIRANGKPALTWGGRFPDSNPPDTMHWQINVAPADCAKVTWDKGGSVVWSKPGDDIKDIFDADKVFENQGTFAPGVKQATYEPGTLAEANDRIWITMARITDWCTRNAK